MSAYCRTRTNFDKAKLSKELQEAWFLTPLKPFPKIEDTIRAGVKRIEKGSPCLSWL